MGNLTKNKTNKFKLFSVVILTGLLQSCAVGECLRYESRLQYRTVCDRYSSSGWCAASHQDSYLADVCVERAPPPK